MKKNILLSILTVLLALLMLFLIGGAGYMLYESYQSSQQNIQSFAQMQEIKDVKESEAREKEKAEKAAKEAEEAAAAAEAARLAAETETEEPEPQIELIALNEDGSVLVENVDEYMVATDAVNIRASYDTESEVIGSAEPDVEVHVTGILYNANGNKMGWARIAMDEGEGFMSTDFLTYPVEEEPAEEEPVE